jgi:hypothetical protein
MRKPTDTVVGLLIGFIVTFVLNAAVSYLTQPKALITTGTVALGPKWYGSIEIENYSQDTLQGLRITLPDTIKLAEIAAVPPVRITGVMGTNVGGVSRGMAFW